jgi:hypothetical protein
MKTLALALLISMAPGDASPGVALNVETLQAWDTYVKAAGSRMEERLKDAKPFLWTMESEQRMRLVQGGGIAVEPMAGNGRTVVTNGLIHHWVGAVFIPNSTAGQVMSKLDNYEEYRNLYPPTVTGSKLLARDGDKSQFSLRLARKVSMVTNVIDTDCETTYFRPGPDRWWSISRSTRIQEVRHSGHVDEQLLPAGTGEGFIWRMYGITRVKEVDGGAIIEMEAIVLSRGIPAALAWIVNPIVRRTSRDALQTTLSQTREAVTRSSQTVLTRCCDRDGH